MPGLPGETLASDEARVSRAVAGRIPSSDVVLVHLESGDGETLPPLAARSDSARDVAGSEPTAPTGPVACVQQQAQRG
jgi:hypothetical protein